MTDPISVKGIGTAAKTCFSLVKGVGPLLISQFDYAKFKWLDYKQKQAQLAGYSEFFLAETRSLVELKQEQLRDSLTKTGIDRIRAEENVNLISKEINKLLVYSKIPTHTLYLESKNGQAEQVEHEQPIGINDTWIDRFNELAGKLNEEWRQNLLAKAFAIEAITPNTIGLDTLFTIGMLDQKSFYFFDAILSCSIQLYESYFIPISDVALELEIDVNESTHTISNIMYQLQHTGLIAYDENLGINLIAGNQIHFRYDDNILVAQSPTNKHISSVIASRSGIALASLCEITPNEHGSKIFDLFEKELMDNDAFKLRYKS